MWRGFTLLSWLAVLAGDDDHDHDGDHCNRYDHDHHLMITMITLMHHFSAELVGSFSR